MSIEKSPKDDLTKVKNVHEDTLTFNSNSNINATFSTNSLIINPEEKCTNPELESGKGCEEPSRFQKLVEKYMKCQKRTLAEMLAMRDTENEDSDKDLNFNEELQKILKDPNTFRVPDQIQPNTPYVPPYDYDAYCFNAPGNRCVRGNAVYIGKCDGCPYLNVSWTPRITWSNDGTGEKPNLREYTTCSCTLNYCKDK